MRERRSGLNLGTARSGVARCVALWAAGIALAVTPVSPSALAQESEADEGGLVETTQPNTLRLSGQINRAWMSASSEGRDRKNFFVDNDVSSTRLRLLATGGIHKGLRAGAAMEVEIESNSSNHNDVDWEQSAEVGSPNFSDVIGAENEVLFTERRLEVWANHAKFGRLYLGQGSTAGDGSTEADLSGMSAILVSRMNTNGGGLSFGTPGSGALNNANDVRDYFKSYDGLGRGRADRVRYDTPTWRGFRLQFSHSQNGDNATGLRYSRKIREPLFGAEWLKGTRVALRLAYGNDRSGDREVRTSGSASVLFPIGLNFTFAAATNENRHQQACADADLSSAEAARCALRSSDGVLSDRQDSDFRYFKAGWRMNLIDWGQTRFAIDYGEVENPENTGNIYSATRDVGVKAKSWGAAIVQRVNAAGTELYAGYRRYALDRRLYHSSSGLVDPAEAEPIKVVMIGARVKF